MPTEDFGPIQIPSSLGEELLAETPSRERTRAAIRDLLGDFDRAQKRELVDRVLVRFALWVVDLPASEAHHDAGPGGHLDHALRVTHSVAQALSNSTLRLSHDPVQDARERPVWTHAGFVAALLHDVGKVLDVEVSSPDRKSVWTPRAEPLAAFLARHGLRRTPRELYRFLPGRGLKAHKGRGEIFQACILPDEARLYSARQLSFVTGAYVEAAHWELPPHVPDAAREIASLIRSWDKEESANSQIEARKGTGRVIRPAVVAKNVAALPPDVKVSPDDPIVPEPAPPEAVPGSSTLPAGPDQRPASSLAIPGQDVWGPSLFPTTQDLSAERVVYVLGRLIASGRLPTKGDSAGVFVRPDFAWFVHPTALEAVAKNDDFQCRPDLKQKILVMLARSGVLAPFGPECYVAEIRTAPGSKRTRKAFRIRTASLLDEPGRASLGLWPSEIEVLQRAPAEAGSGEPAA